MFRYISGSFRGLQDVSGEILEVFQDVSERFKELQDASERFQGLLGNSKMFQVTGSFRCALKRPLKHLGTPRSP